MQIVESVQTSGKAIEYEKQMSEAIAYAKKKHAEAEAMEPLDSIYEYFSNPKSKKYLTAFWDKRLRLLTAECDICRNVAKISDSYVYIGKLLSDIRDNDLYTGMIRPNTSYKTVSAYYGTFEDYVKERFGLKRSSAYAFINVYKTFGMPGGTKLKPKYEAYNYSQLSEMLSLPEAKRDEIKPEMTVKEIREIKKRNAAQVVEAVEATFPEVTKQDSITVEAVTEAKPGNTRLLFKNKTEREKWVEKINVNGYVWVDVPTLKMRVYRYDFRNGVSLLRTDLGRSYDTPDGRYYGYMLLVDDPKKYYGYNVSFEFGFGGQTAKSIADFMTTYKAEL